jgi:HB1, ASXL, restriction endonuclease HTH domain
MTAASKSKSTSKTRKHSPEATERLRKAALKEVQARIEAGEKVEAAPPPGPQRDYEALAEFFPDPGPASKAKGGKHNQNPKGDPVAPVAKLAKSPAGGSAPATTTKQLGGLDAAAIVLKDAGAPLNSKQIWAAIDAKKMWFTEGKTPEATIYSAILREIAANGMNSRFRKAARGRFEFCGKDA